MLKLSRIKKIIIAILLILVVIIFLMFFSGRSKNKINDQNNYQKASPENTRLMSSEEKDNLVGIDQNTEAEVINEQDGLYIYKIKK